MAESDRKFSISWKHTTGFDSPLFNLSADSVGELQNNLNEFFSSGLHDKLLDAIIESKRRYAVKRRAAGVDQSESAPPPPPPEDPWAASGPPPEDPWANSQGVTQQSRPPQQQNTGRGAPNGAPVCRCGQLTEFKESRDKQHSFWRCPSWRWNDGNPTPDHDSIKIR